MKTNPFPFLTTAAAVLLTPAFALEAPEDDAPPPPVAEGGAALPEIKLPAKPQAEAAFLGVVSGEVPEMLADHLGLESGEGVVVRSLVPEGPAAAAGIAVNDVIVKVAGQPVGSPAEIFQQVSSRKPGEKIAVDFIHKGKPATLDVTLGVKPADLAAAEPNPFGQLDLHGLPEELAERVRDAIAGNIGGLELDADAAAVPPRMEEALRDLRERMRGGIQGGIADPGKLQVQGEAKIRMQDQQGSVEVKTHDGAKEVTVRDQQGKVTWNGPWDTAQDKAAAPADVRARVEGLNIDGSFKGPGLRLQMRPGAEQD